MLKNILLKNGIGEIKESGNFENGGSPVQINNVTISIKKYESVSIKVEKALNTSIRAETAYP